MHVSKFKKFLEEINKLNPINEEILKYSSQEIFLLNEIQKEKKIDTNTLFKKNKTHFSRAQYYRYLAKLKKLGCIEIINGKIKLVN